METINSGKALNMFHGLVKRQGGNTKVIDNYDLLPMAKSKTIIKASQKGYLHAYDAKEVGYALIELGGGRKKKSDKVDPAVAIICHKKVGDIVEKNEPLFSILHHDQQKKIAKNLKKDFEHNILAVKKSKPVINPLIVKTIK
jgi:pyrimidine-nucleoside phosphorylase